MTKQPMCILDSNVLIAYFNPKDNLHKKAKSLLLSLDNHKKYLNPFILSEVVTVLLVKTKNQKLVNGILQDLKSYQLTSTITISLNQNLITRTTGIFSLQKGKRLSYPDCSLIAQARLQKIKTIASFDKNLKKEFKSELNFLP